MLLSTAHPYRIHPSCWCWISFQDRWRGRSPWCFLLGGALGVWGAHPVLPCDRKPLPKSTRARKRVDSQSVDGSLMMWQVVVWSVLQWTHSLRPSSLSQVVIGRWPLTPWSSDPLQVSSHRGVFPGHCWTLLAPGGPVVFFSLYNCAKNFWDVFCAVQIKIHWLVDYHS